MKASRKYLALFLVFAIVFAMSIAPASAQAPEEWSLLSELQGEPLEEEIPEENPQEQPVPDEPVLPDAPVIPEEPESEVPVQPDIPGIPDEPEPEETSSPALPEVPDDTMVPQQSALPAPSTAPEETIPPVPEKPTASATPGVSPTVVPSASPSPIATAIPEVSSSPTPDPLKTRMATGDVRGAPGTWPATQYKKYDSNHSSELGTLPDGGEFQPQYPAESVPAAGQGDLSWEGYKFAGWYRWYFPTSSIPAAVVQPEDSLQLIMEDGQPSIIVVYLKPFWQPLVTASDKIVAYNGLPHTIDISGADSKSTFHYSLDGTPYNENPALTDVGVYVITAEAGLDYGDRISSGTGTATLTIYGQVNYDGNGGNGSVEDGNAYDREDAYQLKSNEDGFRKSGYQFIGWSTSPVGGDLLQPGYEGRMGTQSITYYAQWKKRPAPVVPDPTASPIPPIPPAPTATPKPTVAPTATPGPSATPAPTATPGPSATPAPTATPGPSAATPKPTTVPTATPQPTAAPTATPQPTAAPTLVPPAETNPPVVTSPPVVTAPPVVPPRPDPVVTASPRPVATPRATTTPRPTVRPTVKPTEKPSPTPAASPLVPGTVKTPPPGGNLPTEKPDRPNILFPNPSTPAYLLIPENRVPQAFTREVWQGWSANNAPVPLAYGLMGPTQKINGTHHCCIIHFLVMILLIGLVLVFTRNAKKRQARIFECRRELAEWGIYPDARLPDNVPVTENK